MVSNLLLETWTELDSFESRLLLDARIGGPGQYDTSDNQNKLYLPLAGSTCRVVLTFREKKICSVEPGPAFDAPEWARMSGVKVIQKGSTATGTAPRYLSSASQIRERDPVEFPAGREIGDDEPVKLAESFNIHFVEPSGFVENPRGRGRLVNVIERTCSSVF